MSAGCGRRSRTRSSSARSAPMRCWSAPPSGPWRTTRWCCPSAQPRSRGCCRSRATPTSSPRRCTRCSASGGGCGASTARRSPRERPRRPNGSRRPGPRPRAGYGRARRVVSRRRWRRPERAGPPTALLGPRVGALAAPSGPRTAGRHQEGRRRAGRRQAVVLRPGAGGPSAGGAGRRRPAAARARRRGRPTRRRGGDARGAGWGRAEWRRRGGPVGPQPRGGRDGAPDQPAGCPRDRSSLIQLVPGYTFRPDRPRRGSP